MNYDEVFLKDYLKHFLGQIKNEKFKDKYIDSFPDKLYRFRKCNNYNFESIDQSYIRLSIPSEFSDAADSTIKFNFENNKADVAEIFLEWAPYIMKNKSSKTKYGNVYSDINTNKKIVFEFKQKIYDDSSIVNYDKVRQILLSKGVKKDQVNLFISKLELLIGSEAFKTLSEQQYQDFYNRVSNIRDTYYVTCFTNSYENNNLWETYAEKYTGYCIEYDFNEEIKKNIKEILFGFAPMLYGDKRSINFVDLFQMAKNKYCGEKLDTNKLNELDVLMHLHARTKDITYSQEREWRFYKKKESIENRKFNFPFISRIILGKDIKPRNKARIINLAKKYKFEVHQQKFNNLISKFWYEKIYPLC